MKSGIADYEGRLQISIPVQRFGVGLFLACWLALWILGGLSIFKRLLEKPNLFEGIWICFWLVSVPVATYALLRSIGGSDVILADPQSLIIRREIFGLGRGKGYLPSEIRRLRFQPQMGGGRSQRASRIAFDYGAKTIAFGDGVEESEANQLIALIQERCNIREATQPAILTTPV